jgi:hypothetical protein
MKREDGNWTQNSIGIGLREYSWIESLDDIVIGTEPIN